MTMRDLTGGVTRGVSLKLAVLGLCLASVIAMHDECSSSTDCDGLAPATNGDQHSNGACPRQWNIIQSSAQREQSGGQREQSSGERLEEQIRNLKNQTRRAQYKKRHKDAIKKDLEEATAKAIEEHKKARTEQLKAREAETQRMIKEIERQERSYNQAVKADEGRIYDYEARGKTIRAKPYMSPNDNDAAGSDNADDDLPLVRDERRNSVTTQKIKNLEERIKRARQRLESYEKKTQEVKAELDQRVKDETSDTECRAQELAGELVKDGEHDEKFNKLIKNEKNIKNGKWQAAAGIGAFFAGGIGVSSLLVALNIEDFAHGISNPLQIASMAISVVCLMVFAALIVVVFKKGCGLSGAAYATGSFAFSGLIGFGIYNVVGSITSAVPVDPTLEMHNVTADPNLWIGVGCLLGGAVLLGVALKCACKHQCCRKHAVAIDWDF